MANWTPSELSRIEAATELRVRSQREDGSLRPAVTIWVGVVDDGVYIRSAHGPENGWFRRAERAGTGTISAGGVDKEVTFELADAAVQHPLDAALHRKYDRFGPGPVGAITGPDVLATTLKVLPRG